MQEFSELEATIAQVQRSVCIAILYSLQKFTTFCAVNILLFEVITTEMQKNIEGDEYFD